MAEVENLKKVSAEYARHDSGTLTIACTHAQARYLLPRVIPSFRARFPKVHLILSEGSPPHLAQMVLHERADLAIATETLAETPGLVALPVYPWQHTVVVAPDHPLADLPANRASELTLERIAQYPIVTYDRKFSGRPTIDEAFAKAGIEPNIVLEAIDADVIKTYVDVGLGIGIIAGMAFDPRRDKALVGLTARQLFGTHITRVALRAGSYLRDSMYLFLVVLSADFTRERVDKAMFG